MKSRFGLKESVEVHLVHENKSIENYKGMNDFFNPRGIFNIEHFRNNRKIESYVVPNTITLPAKDNILNVYFSSGTQTTSWYCGLIDNSGYTATANTDTMASHPGWNEFTTYSNSTRPSWGVGSSSGQSVTNASPTTFNINGNGTVKGIFVTSVNTISGNTGILWTSALFSANVSVVNGDSLKITYTVNAS